jgi:hypothetical protein
MQSVRLEIILYHFCVLVNEQVCTLITTVIARPVLTGLESFARISRLFSYRKKPV